MSPSQALSDFHQGLAMATALLDLDVKLHSDPPAGNDRLVAEGLRGGAAILMVAAFEQFLRQAIEEHVATLITRPHPLALSSLPAKMYERCVWQSFETAMRGRLSGTGKGRSARVPEIVRVSTIVASDVINPSAFAEMGNNPSSEQVSELFKGFDVQDFFGRIRTNFEGLWGRSETARFVPDSLDTIVNRRHQVAHTASALNVSRVDLKSSILFLECLANVLDDELNSIVSGI